MHQHRAPNRAEYYERLINMGCSPEAAKAATDVLFGWLDNRPR